MRPYRRLEFTPVLFGVPRLAPADRPNWTDSPVSCSVSSSFKFVFFYKLAANHFLWPASFLSFPLYLIKLFSGSAPSSDQRVQKLASRSHLA